MNEVKDHHDLTIMLDNESIYNVCKRGGFNLDYYNADTINRMIALTASSVTSSKRFKGESVSVTDFV